LFIVKKQNKTKTLQPPKIMTKHTTTEADH